MASTTVEHTTTVTVEQVSITLNDEAIEVQVQNVEEDTAEQLLVDADMYDDECYDCLNCDYEHFDQWSEHLSVPGTPALTHSPSMTPSETPSTPLFMPFALTPAPLKSSEHLTLGERLISACTSGLAALGTTALNAILPADGDDKVLRLSPRLSASDKSDDLAFSSTPAVLLEPARPGAHVRFLVREPRVSRMLPVSTIAALGSSLFTSTEEGVSEDEEFEMFEEGLEI